MPDITMKRLGNAIADGLLIALSAVLCLLINAALAAERLVKRNAQR